MTQYGPSQVAVVGLGCVSPGGGNGPNPELPTQLNETAVFALPSHHEGRVKRLSRDALSGSGRSA